MKLIQECIEQVKNKEGSYRKAAKALGITAPGLLDQVNGNAVPKDEHIMKLAKYLGIEPDKLLLDAAASRSKGEAHKRWEKIAKKYNSMAASIIGASMSYPLLQAALDSGIVYYVKSSKRKEMIKFASFWRCKNGLAITNH